MDSLIFRRPRRKAATEIDFRQLAGLAMTSEEIEAELMDSESEQQQKPSASSTPKKRNNKKLHNCHICAKSDSISVDLPPESDLLDCLSNLIDCRRTCTARVCPLCHKLLLKLDDLEKEVVSLKKSILDSFSEAQKKKIKLEEFVLPNVRIEVIDLEVDKPTFVPFSASSSSEALNDSLLLDLSDLMNDSLIRDHHDEEVEVFVIKGDKDQEEVKLPAPPTVLVTKAELELLRPEVKKSGEVSVESGQLGLLGAHYEIVPQDGRLVITTKRVLDHQYGGGVMDDSKMDTNGHACKHCHQEFDSLITLLKHLLTFDHNEPTTVTYGCDLCTTVLDTEEQLVSHVANEHATNNSDTLHHCPNCGKNFRRLAAFKQHLQQIHHGVQPKFNCDKCEKLFSRQENLTAHMRMHRGEKPFVCQICGKGFTRKASMLEHAARHKGIRDRECLICKKKFYSTSYWRHMATVHVSEEKLVHKCSFCGRQFAQLFRLRNHETTHLAYEQRGFVCEKCPDERRFATKHRLKTHEKQVHEGEKVHGSKLCPDCGMMFSSVGSLHAHRKRQHLKEADVVDTTTTTTIAATVQEEVVVQQDYPDFDGNAILQIQTVPDSQNPDPVQFDGTNTSFVITGADMSDPHPHQLVLQTESGSFVLPLDEAPGVNMKQAKEMKVFEISASGGEQLGKDPPAQSSSYACQTCEKPFATVKARVQHERNVHSKGKSVNCPVCGRMFANSHYLKDHARVHSEERPFKCNICNKTFRLAKQLTRHNRVHTGEKPYKCVDCGKAFSASSNLSEHRTLHTGRMAYECDSCKKKFRLWTTLKKHHLRCVAKLNASMLPQVFPADDPGTLSHIMGEQHSNLLVRDNNQLSLPLAGEIDQVVSGPEIQRTIYVLETDKELDHVMNPHN